MTQPGGRSPAPVALALAQDLANTVDIERGADSLETRADLSHFAASHDLQGLKFSGSDVRRIRAFRSILRAVFLAHAGQKVAGSRIRQANAALSTASLQLRVDETGDVQLVPHATLDGAAAVTAHVAAGIARSIDDGSWYRLKACASDECRWVYFDRSRSGASRWCTMKICGSRAKMRRYRAAREALDRR